MPEKPKKGGKPVPTLSEREDWPVEQALLSEISVRQPFVVGASYLEKLQDYGYERRMLGDYLHSRRQALALLLAGSYVAPAHLRKRERQQRVGRRLGKDRGGEVPLVS